MSRHRTVHTAPHDGGLEVRHMKNVREHYTVTFAPVVANLEASWDAAVAEHLASPVE